MYISLTFPIAWNRMLMVLNKAQFKNTVVVSTPIKVSRFGNCESFLDFHELFFENLLKIGTVFLAINLQSLTNLQFSESTYERKAGCYGTL